MSFWMNILFAVGILVAKAFEIGLSSVKLIFLNRNNILTWVTAFLESLVYCFLISGLIANLKQNTIWVFGYSLGFATGYLLGSFVSGKLAKKLNLDFSKVEIVIPEKYEEKIEEFCKEQNVGYTKFRSSGIHENYCFEMIVKKYKTKAFVESVKKLTENEGFISISDITRVIGGVGL